MNKEIYNKLTKQEKIVADKIEAKYKESRAGRRKKDIILMFLLSFLIVVFLGASFSIGYFIGVKATANYFAETAALFLKSTDIQITANLSLNETKIVDYMFEKLDTNKTGSGITQKEYIPPCNPDPSIPRGETSRCIGEQIIGEQIIEGQTINIPGTVYVCDKPIYKDGYYYCDSNDIQDKTRQDLINASVWWGK